MWGEADILGTISVVIVIKALEDSARDAEMLRFQFVVFHPSICNDLA